MSSTIVIMIVPCVEKTMKKVSIMFGVNIGAKDKKNETFLFNWCFVITLLSR